MMTQASHDHRPYGASTTSADVIAAAMALFLPPGQVAELRALTPRGVVSGYFDDIDKFATAASQLSGSASGVYFTPNPTTPALLARASNRVLVRAKQTTSDHDIECLRWLLIDDDPVRPAGISSTKAEHEAALTRTRDLATWLRRRGFQDLIVADSGNGGHCMVPIDLPNDAASTTLIKRCLDTLALYFTDQTVMVDLTTFNPARIWKVYGTLACKGDSTPDRPHRLACILEAPESFTPNPRELLEQLAALAPEEPPRHHARSTSRGTGTFDLEQWIEKHNLNVVGPRSWQGGRKWIFTTCPWNADHTNAAAFIVQLTNGAVAAGCHHNGCTDKGWHDLRDTVEPGWREWWNKNGAEFRSGKAHENKPEADDAEEEEEDPLGTRPAADAVEPFPLEALPAAFRRAVASSAKALHCPPDYLAVPLLTLAGAAIGTSCEVEIKPGWRERSCLFTAIVAPPGAKKSPALKLASTPLTQRQRDLYAQYKSKKEEYQKKLVEYEVELTAWKKQVAKGAGAADDKPEEPEEPRLEQLFTTDATVEALAGLLEHNTRGVVYLSDELSAWVKGFNQYKNGKGADRQAWLSFWSGAQVIVNRKNRKDPIVLDAPFVAVTGCLPPDVLPELSDERGREDGFVHRLLFSFPDPLPGRWVEDQIDPRLLAHLSEIFQTLWNLRPEIDEEERSTPRVLRFSPAAKGAWREWITAHYEEQSVDEFPEHLRGPWAKLEGLCARIALIIHCCRQAGGETHNGDLDEESVTAAWALIDYFKSHARRVYAHLRTTQDDQRAEQARHWIETHGGRTTTRDLLRAGAAGVKTASEAKKLLNDLVDRGWGKLQQMGRREIFILHQPDTRHFDENEERTRA